MSRCRDERLTYLRDLGYNVISLPRAGIRPLSLAFLQGRRLIELGYLPEIWASKSAEPKPIPDEDVAKMSGKSTSQLAANVGLDILSNLVQAIGIDPVKVKAEYRDAHTLEFQFQDVVRERITAAALGEYLKNGRLSTKNAFVRRYVGTDEKFYIVTEVLKSKSFGVTARNSAKAGLEVKVPVIQQAASGEAGVTVERKAEGTVEFAGPKELPFAFIAAQLTRTGDEWEVVEFPRPGTIHFGLTDGTAPAADGFTRVKDGAVLFGDEEVDFDERPDEGDDEEAERPDEDESNEEGRGP